jgi:hypothetical protein
MTHRLFGTALAAVFVGLTAGRAQPALTVDEVVARVGERVAELHKRLQNVVCTEMATVQPIGFNFSPEGMSRTVESELRVEAEGGDPPGDPAVVRQVRKVNGRAPRERDKKDRSGCTDPNPLSAEPLAFLLPVHRSEYRFKLTGSGNEQKRNALIVDFESIDRRTNPELIEDKSGHDDCFDWSGHIPTKGRIWIDAESFDVLRVVRGNRGPVDVNVPVRLQRLHRLDGYVTIDRDDTTIRYRTVAFSDPDEILLVPESIDSLLLVRGGLQSTRRSQTFSDYKRFVTAGRVVK